MESSLKMTPIPVVELFQSHGSCQIQPQIDHCISGKKGTAAAGTQGATRERCVDPLASRRAQVAVPQTIPTGGTPVRFILGPADLVLEKRPNLLRLFQDNLFAK